MGLAKALTIEGASLIEISELIFFSGTRRSPGVGMDAVRRFLEQDGGSIEIELKSDDQRAEYTPFVFLINLSCEQIQLAS